MDPTSTILVLNALTSAAKEALTNSASETVQDGYQTLKGLLTKRFEGTPDKPVTDLVLEKYEEQPEVWKAPLEEVLLRTNNVQDQQIVEAAQKLATLVTPRDAAYDRLATDASATRTQLEQIYRQGQDQAKQWSLFSLIAAILGFLVILVGIIAVLTLNVAAGLITSISGIIPEVAAALFFQQARDANKRVDTISDKLVEVGKIHRAIELALTEDDTSQSRLKELIMKKLLETPFKE